ncbi:MAG: Gfo/Idh/MocA family oxidoreductase, partial [Caulobacteraceae bacterium]
MASILRAGVVGAGVFGSPHAAQSARRAEVELAAIFDPHPERAQALAGRFGAAACADLASLLPRFDVVSIAAPAHAHAALALAALAAGKPIYVEKPIAICLEGADAIAEAAARTGLAVACGFLERSLFEAIG